jgi:AraC-like DNA-binding protein
MGEDHDRKSGIAAPASDGAGPDGDALSDVLETVRLTGAMSFVVEARPPWIAASPDASALAPVILRRAQHVVSYHVIVEGACWCQMEGLSPVRLEAGDVFVAPHGDAYALSSTPDLKNALSVPEMLGWFRLMASGQLPFVVEEGEGGAASIKVICGFLGCDALPFNPALSALPRLLHVRGAGASDGDRLSALIDFVTAESRDPRAGRRSVLLRAGELLFVEVVRRHLATLTTEHEGWLAGLRDPLVGRALACLHGEPSRAWTLDELARETGSSRSVLAERFANFVGEPPMHYLTRWRMQRAAGMLIDGNAKVSAIARQVGYDSEAAFSRAFKKHAGASPDAWRRRRESAQRAVRRP